MKEQIQLRNKDTKPPRNERTGLDIFCEGMERISEVWMNGIVTQPLTWPFGGIRAKSYVCGFCGSKVAPNQGAIAKGSMGNDAWICICHNCTRPTFFDIYGKQHPAEAFGKNVEGIPDAAVLAIYNDARQAVASGAFTAAVLCCRTLLMHVAVEQGEPTGKSFASYVNFLCKKFAPSGQDWIDQIREWGNDANHKIVVMKKEDAEHILQFTEMLLKIIYEYPNRAAAKTKSKRTSK
jgi:Domain of unknown function (DUF4145)